MKQKAFTLAEILVVVGIIGVVSMITVPNLTQGTSSTETIAKVKQFDADLQNALELATERYGDNLTDTDTIAAFGERLSQYFNVSKTCGVAIGQGCFASSNVTALSGANTISSLDRNARLYKVILKDGSSIAITNDVCINNEKTMTCSLYKLPSGLYTLSKMSLYFDVDGPRKGLNRLGSDIFWFVSTSDGLYHSSMESFGEGSINSYCKTLVSENYCADWILNFGNMEYLDCDDLTYDNPTCD